ncbi:MAG: helix-turn-helix domain-containing protein [Pararhodobacter sp.]|nr:helix-turn-helix domain-containing protein [Pararhodobacter sp.]
MADRFLNQANLARRWHVSPRTLERWRWTGEGPAFVKIGGRVVYRLEDVEAYECGRRCESTAQATALRVVQ